MLPSSSGPVNVGNDMVGQNPGTVPRDRELVTRDREPVVVVVVDSGCCCGLGGCREAVWPGAG